MKIGVITSAYPEFKDDPHGIFVHRLMREISNQGHEVYVLAPFTGKKTEYVLDGVKVKRFHYFFPKRFQKLCGRSGMIDNVKEGFFVKFQLLTFILFNAINSLKEFKNVDLIHIHWLIPNGLGALLAKKINKIQYISTLYGEEIYLSKHYKTTFILRNLINNSVQSVAISKGTLDACTKIGINDKKTKIIPYGIDSNFFRPINIEKNENIIKILSVGYLIERKGFEYLIKAMEQVLIEYENVKLTIIGSGPFEKRLNKLIIHLKLQNNIKILKNVSDDELLYLYNSSDIFVLPSIIDLQGNTEGLGVVLLEAMACKLPVIGSNVGGIPDIIKNDHNGLLIPEKSPYEIAKAITLLIENKDLREKYAINGYESVKNKFSWKIIAKEYIKLYRSII